jgi:phospholipase/carboxylesterase
MSDLLPAIEVETADKPDHAVIWLHGLGADGSDFVPVVTELGLPASLGIRFVFPHAPEIPVTCNGGYVMPAWYDILSLEKNNRIIDEAGILASCTAVRRLIAREQQRGIPCEHIVLAGFSQGGAVAYTTALTHPEPLAGIVALSTYIPSQRLIPNAATSANRAIAIFSAHGTEDDVVSLEMGKQAKSFLDDAGYQTSWHEYSMPHSVCLAEIKDIGQWFRHNLSRA